MVAIVLIVLASGLISHKMYGAIAKKRFKSEVERVKEQMMAGQKLAVSMQADWVAKFEKNGNDWLFSLLSHEIEGQKFKPLKLDDYKIVFSGTLVRNSLTFDFFASGYIYPTGALQFQKDKEQISIHTSDLFKKNEGKKSGPTHPASLR